jgi:hypothetical protein
MASFSIGGKLLVVVSLFVATIAAAVDVPKPGTTVLDELDRDRISYRGSEG